MKDLQSPITRIIDIPFDPLFYPTMHCARVAVENNLEIFVYRIVRENGEWTHAIVFEENIAIQIGTALIKPQGRGNTMEEALADLSGQMKAGQLVQITSQGYDYF